MMRILLASALAIMMTATTVFAEQRALLVGVGKYAAPEHNLPAIDLDIERMAAALAGPAKYHLARPASSDHFWPVNIRWALRLSRACAPVRSYPADAAQWPNRNGAHNRVNIIADHRPDRDLRRDVSGNPLADPVEPLLHLPVGSQSTDDVGADVGGDLQHLFEPFPLVEVGGEPEAGDGGGRQRLGPTQQFSFGRRSVVHSGELGVRRPRRSRTARRVRSPQGSRDR